MSSTKKNEANRKIEQKGMEEDSIKNPNDSVLNSEVKDRIDKFHNIKIVYQPENDNNLVPSNSLITTFSEKEPFTSNLNASEETPEKSLTNPNIHLLNEHKVRSHGCKHYKRKCLIQFMCCNRLYACRLCHNKIEDHKCDRKEIQFLICLLCMTKQPFSEKCINCLVLFSAYICDECKFLSDDLQTYHCYECGVCRKGPRSNYFHCKQCNACLPSYIKKYHLDQQYKKNKKVKTQDDNKNVDSSIIEIFNGIKPVSTKKSLINDTIDSKSGQDRSIYNDSTYKDSIGDGFDEKCNNQFKNTNELDSNRLDDCFDRMRMNTHVENTLKSICPICAQDLFYSTSYVVLMNCGHSIHKKCLISYKNKSFQCPICLKSTSSNQTVNERIDYILDQCKDLNEQKNINSYECITSCFDCQAKYTVKYKYLYNKCLGCGSYNTRINELYKREDEEQS